MSGFTPTLDPCAARHRLQHLIKPDIAAPFLSDIRRLASMFSAFVASCPPPWPGPGLALTPEIHYQSELWLPLAQIRPAFQRLYRTSLTYAPILSSSPFADAASWAEIVQRCRPFVTTSLNPAFLLERLLADAELRAKFLLWSFLPTRFHGNSLERYPLQSSFATTWLAAQPKGNGPLRCLDAACGDGAGTYGLARLLLDQGRQPETWHIEGWTIDPLEVWAAAHACFPHDPGRERAFRSWVMPVFDQGAERAIIFRAMDLLDGVPPFAKGGAGGISLGAELQIPLNPLGPTYGSPLIQGEARFDLILCNGLLGGPIVNSETDLTWVARNLAALLRPGGILLAADRFHGGWKKNIPKETLGDVFKRCRLVVSEAGEGIVGLKPDK